jgi:hypothetical protein
LLFAALLRSSVHPSFRSFSRTPQPRTALHGRSRQSPSRHRSVASGAAAARAASGPHGRRAEERYELASPNCPRPSPSITLNPTLNLIDYSREMRERNGSRWPICAAAMASRTCRLRVKNGSGGISRTCPLLPNTDIRRGERHVCFGHKISSIAARSPGVRPRWPDRARQRTLDEV